MNDKLKRVYVPMTETAFYILFHLQQERHGYDITQKTNTQLKSKIAEVQSLCTIDLS